MRLSKRIAAVALAAVMAVSMLTACGGGGGGSNGGSSSSGSNNGSSSSSSSSGSASSGSSSGSSSSSSSGSSSSSSTGGGSGTTVTSTTWAQSRTKKMFNGSALYIKYHGNVYENNVAIAATIEMTTDFKNEYALINAAGFRVGMLLDATQNKGYTILDPDMANKLLPNLPEDYRGKTVYWVGDVKLPPELVPAVKDSDKVEIQRYKLDDKYYYAEIVIENGNKSTFCYDEKNGELRAIVPADEDEVMYVDSVRTTGVNTSVLKLPKDAYDITGLDILMD